MELSLHRVQLKAALDSQSTLLKLKQSGELAEMVKTVTLAVAETVETVEPVPAKRRQQISEALALTNSTAKAATSGNSQELSAPD